MARWGLWLALCCVLPATAQTATPLLGQPAPAVHLHALDGRTIDLATLRGQVVVLNFWASWCAPCQAELPRFEQWQQPGLTVVALSIDDETESAARVVRRLHLTMPVAMADTQVAESYGGVLGVPVTFLIDRQGRVRARLDGETNLDQLHERIRMLLDEPQGASPSKSTHP